MFSDQAIQFCLSIKCLFNLPLRQTMDMTESLDYRRRWRKVHLGIDAGTLEIRAMEVTDNSIGMHPSCRDYSARFPPTNLSPASAATASTTRRRATRPSLCVRRRLPSPPARTPGPGKPTAAVPIHEMKSCGPHAGWVGRSGRNEAATIGAAWLKPKCAASSSWANASGYATLIVRSPSCRYSQLC